jgi:hypothetical protein
MVSSPISALSYNDNGVTLIKPGQKPGLRAEAASSRRTESFAPSALRGRSRSAAEHAWLSFVSRA